MSILETKASQTNTKTLRRNTIISFVGQVAVALCAIIMVPIIIHRLGYAAYGLLSLALTIFGSFSLLELGLGRATTKFVAEYLRTQEFDKISSVVWTSLLIQLIIGSVAGGVFYICAPLIVQKMTIAANMLPEAEKMFRVLAFSIPLILGSSALRGALEGAQRFDITNYIKIPLNVFTYLIPLVCAKIGFSVSSIVLVMFIVRFLGTLVFLICCFSVLPQIKKIKLFQKIGVKDLFSYAGWVAVSNFIVPFLVQVDRYFIATLVAVSSVTFYAVPFEILNGLWIIPGSIAAALFPAFSSSKNTDANFTDLFVRPVKYILISLGPIVLLLVVFSKDILLLWQGPVISQNSYHVLQILVIGVLINSLGWVPSNLLMGSGRPDLTAKVHIIQTPLYLVGAYFLIVKFGIIGAAVAFTLRVIFEAVLLFGLTFHIYKDLLKPFLLKTVKSSVFVIILAIVLFGQKALSIVSLFQNLLLSVVIMCVYGVVMWFFILDEFDKKLIPNPFKK